MREPQAQLIRRILVALDASTDSLAALDAAAKLAARVNAELVGLFVEDINLLHLAGLPFTREMRFSRLEDINHEQMEEALRLQAAQARRALMQAADRRSVNWSFKVVRGQVTPEVLAAALEADLLTLGKASRPLSRHSRLGSTARTLIEQAPHSILLTQHLTEENQPVLVTYDGSLEAQKALQVAVYIALANQLKLTVLVLAGDPEEMQTLAQHAADRLTHYSSELPDVEYVRLPKPDVIQLIEAVRLEGGGTLVLGSGGPLLQANIIQTLLDELDCPLLIVR